MGTRYTRDQQLAIGKEIYDGVLKLGQASGKYNINYYTARDYYRMYREINNLESPFIQGKNAKKNNIPFEVRKEKKAKYEDLLEMNKGELMREVVKARVETERAKKGYTVKGDGQTKEYIILSNENSK